MVNEKNFCIGPWSEIRILPDGRLNWCHFSHYEHSTDYIDSVDLDTYFNGTSVQEVRNTLLAGNEVSACEKCYNDETKVVYSYRRRRNVQMAIFPLQHFAKSYQESPMPARITQSSIKPYFYPAGTVGNAKDLRGESLIVRQVRSKKFWLVTRYENGTYSKPHA